MRHSVEVQFHADDPTAAGHFPGNPIIPGALLLDEVLRAIAGTGAMLPSVIRSAKFLSPVRPGDAVMVGWEVTGAGQIRFECRTREAGELVLVGTAEHEVAAR